MRQYLVLLLPTVALLATLGCTSQTPEAGGACPEGFQNSVSYRLYFGLDHADGRSVSADEWDAFLADTITPRFPWGLSVIDVKGQWQKPDGELERENTKLVLLNHPPPLADGLTRIDEISREYERRFRQDPVYREIFEKMCNGLYVWR